MVQGSIDPGGYKVMIVAYILVITNPTMEHRVYRALKKLKGIDESYALLGEYDIILKVHSNNYNDLAKFVIKKVRSIPGVIDTETLAGVDIM